MRRFLLRLACFLLPVLVVFAGMFGIFVASGELCDIDAVAQRMAAGEPLRFEMNYRLSATQNLKSRTATLRGAELLVLGTSRSMQFRAEMFPTADFYNAGGAISQLGQILPFLKTFPEEQRPKTLLLCLDQYFFNAVWDPCPASEATYVPTPETTDTMNMLMRFLHHFGEGKINLFRLLGAGSSVLGVPARVRGSGFCTDGSYLYGTQALDANVDLSFSDSIRRIATGTNRFEYADTVNPSALAVLEELLDWCAQNDIYVVAYLPPYAPSVYAAMQQSGQYGYLDKLYPSVLEIFDKFGMECYDFTVMENTADADFSDGFHAGDVVYCKTLLAMLESGSALADVTSAAVQEELIASATNPRVIPQ